MTREDFIRWQEDPVTRAVIAAHKRTAEDLKAEWSRISWDNGAANPMVLQEMRVRADAYLAIVQMMYEDVAHTLGIEVRED